MLLLLFFFIVGSHKVFGRMGQQTVKVLCSLQSGQSCIKPELVGTGGFIQYLLQLESELNMLPLAIIFDDLLVISHSRSIQKFRK